MQFLVSTSKNGSGSGGGDGAQWTIGFHFLCASLLVAAAGPDPPDNIPNCPLWQQDVVNLLLSSFAVSSSSAFLAKLTSRPNDSPCHSVVKSRKAGLEMVAVVLPAFMTTCVSHGFSPHTE